MAIFNKFLVQLWSENRTDIVHEYYELFCDLDEACKHAAGKRAKFPGVTGYTVIGPDGKAAATGLFFDVNL